MPAIVKFLKDGYIDKNLCTVYKGFFINGRKEMNDYRLGSLSPL